MGRFLSPDWSSKIEPIPFASLTNPQSLNLYAYVHNDPLGAIDPDGHLLHGEGGPPSCVAAGSLGCSAEENEEFFEQATHTGSAALMPQQQSGPQAQQNQSDQPSFSIQASQGDLQLINSQGSTVADYWYTTGMSGDTNPKDKGRGPLPPGEYTLNPKEISKAGFFRRFIDPRDWGDYRVPLHPVAGTNTYGRSGFFLHGGWKRLGSEGCIKVNDLHQDRLFELLQHNSGPVEVTVH